MAADWNRMKFLSLGAGVQSTTLALMSAAGEFEMPDCAIFADTMWEPKAVYDHLDRLERALPFPVYRVSAGSIRDHIVNGQPSDSNNFSPIPWHSTAPEGSHGIGRRQCSKDFKLIPIAKEQRRLLGYQPRQRIPAGSAEVWIGISMDEAMRMKPAWNKWQVNRWPLIEMRMTRADCEKWLANHGWSAPRSACIGCPFHNDTEWRKLKGGDKAAWADAIEIDRMIRDPRRGFLSKQYAHRSCVPLDEVDLSTEEERGQLNMFINECEGICGV